MDTIGLNGYDVTNGYDKCNTKNGFFNHFGQITIYGENGIRQKMSLFAENKV